MERIRGSIRESFKPLAVTIQRSSLLDRLAASAQRRAPIEQWLNFVMKMPGAPREEREAIANGLRSTLADVKMARGQVKLGDVLAIGYESLRPFTPTVGSYTTFSFRQSVGVRARANQVPNRVEARAKPFVDAATVCYQHPAMGYWIVKTGYQDLATRGPNWIVLDDRGNLVRDPDDDSAWFQSDIRALDVMHLAISQRFRDYESERAFLQYNLHTLPAGGNPREWMVQLPNWPADYSGPHFREARNLLVHLRTTERVMVSGERILFVEEIQSDWHADCKENSPLHRNIGIDNDGGRLPPFRKTWHEFGVKVALMIAHKHGFKHVGFSNARVQLNRWGEMEGLRRLYDELIPATLSEVDKRFGCNLRWDGVMTRQRHHSVSRVGDDRWRVSERERGGRTQDIVRQRGVAEYFADQRGKVVAERVRVLEISDELEGNLAGVGLPLFGV